MKPSLPPAFRPNVFFATLALAFVAASGVASADQTDPGAARLGFLKGDVSITRGDSNQPAAAALNAPLTAGDSLSTGDGARAEIQFDSTTVLRVESNTDVQLAHVDANSREAQLARGTIALRLFDDPGVQSIVDTPSVSIRPDSSGAYRVTVTDDGRTELTVRSGKAEVSTPGGIQVVKSGQTVVAQGDPDKATVNFEDEIARDAFDDFGDQRDALVARATQDDALPSGLAYDDLDQYGTWHDDPAYGRVWAPDEAEDWSPYLDGRWVWESSFGWTWVADEPWGWAPYHYGRWFYGIDGWCWYPPAPGIAAVWSPGYVAFVGFGDGFGLGYANFGWIPLGPGDPWAPWYGWYGGVYGPTLVNRYSSVSIKNIHVNKIVYVNATRGIVSMPVRSFSGGTFERGRVTPLAEAGQLHQYRGGPPFAPSAESLRFSDKPVPKELAMHAFPSATHFAGKNTDAGREPFTQTRAQIASHLGRTQDEATRTGTNPLVSHGAGNGFSHGFPSGTQHGTSHGTYGSPHGTSGASHGNSQPHGASPHGSTHGSSTGHGGSHPSGEKKPH